MRNYFLLYTPFHFEYVRKIISTCFREQDNYIVNHFKKPVDLPGNGVRQVVNLRNRSAHRIKDISAAKRQLLAAARSGDTVQIFIPHTLGILSNYSFYTLARKYKNVRINVFYEGVILFYNYDHSYTENLKYYVSRWAASLMSLIPYVFNKRLLDMHDGRIKEIYTPFTNIDAPPEKIKEISLEPVNYKPEPGICVILGLIMEKRYMDELPKIIAGLYRKADEFNIKKIYFKDHPLDKCELFHTMAKAQGKELVLINDTSPIEKIISKYSPGVILSSWSSGLVNLRNMIPAEVRICCVITKRITETAELKRLADAFEEQQIEIAYV